MRTQRYFFLAGSTVFAENPTVDPRDGHPETTTYYRYATDTTSYRRPTTAFVTGFYTNM